MRNRIHLPDLKVRRSSAGLGLFTEENISKDKLVVEYTGERIDEEEKERRGGRYLFEVTDNLFIDGKNRENIARYINHSCRPNCEAEHNVDEDRIFIRAVKSIRKGEEITFDYGKEYLEEIIGRRNCRCAQCANKD